MRSDSQLVNPYLGLRSRYATIRDIRSRVTRCLPYSQKNRGLYTLVQNSLEYSNLCSANRSCIEIVAQNNTCLYKRTTENRKNVQITTIQVSSTENGSFPASDRADIRTRWGGQSTTALQRKPPRAKIETFPGTNSKLTYWPTENQWEE